MSPGRNCRQAGACPMVQAPMTVLFIGSEIYRLEVFAPPHPLAMPLADAGEGRCQLPVDGWTRRGVLSRRRQPASRELCRFHAPDYIAALMRAEAEQTLPAELRERYRIGADANVIHKAVFRRPAHIRGRGADGRRASCPGGDGLCAGDWQPSWPAVAGQWFLFRQRYRARDFTHARPRLSPDRLSGPRCASWRWS